MKEIKKKENYSLVSSGNDGSDVLAIRGRKYRKRIEIVLHSLLVLHASTVTYYSAGERKENRQLVGLV
jgi:hypothetical protein